MIGPSKILTVSYGTFSCTLEGFDDPFNTMRAIAEYFRDLAAEDRYFGATPPTPDAEMLHRIAEREVQRRVEARVDEQGIVLRAADGPAAAQVAAPVAVPRTETSAAALATAAVAGPVAAPVARPEEARAAEPEPAAAMEAATESADRPDSVFAEDLTFATEPAAPGMAAPEMAAPAADHDSSDVAAKLARIRAVIAAAQSAKTAPAAAPAAKAGATLEEEEALAAGPAGFDEEPEAAPLEAIAAVDDDFGFDLELDELHAVRPAEAAAAPAEPAAVVEEVAGEAAEEIAVAAIAEPAAETPADVSLVMAGEEEPEAVEAPSETEEASETEDVSGAGEAAAETAEDWTPEWAATDEAMDDEDYAALALATLAGAAPEARAGGDAGTADEAATEDETLDALDLSGWRVAEPAAEAEMIAAEAPADAFDPEGEDDFAALAEDAGAGETAAEEEDEDGEDTSFAADVAPAERRPGFFERARARVINIRRGAAAPEAEAETVEADAETIEAEARATMPVETAGNEPAVEAEDDASHAAIFAALNQAEDESAAFEDDLAETAHEAQGVEAEAEDDAAQDAGTEEAGTEEAAILAGIGAAIDAAGTEPQEEDDELLDELSAIARDARRDAHEGRAILEDHAGDGEASVERLMEEAKSKLEGVESRRRFSAIAHLKAAVAATVADRKLKSHDVTAEEGDAPVEDIERYRDDLSKAVRPRRPTTEGAAVTRRPEISERPAPLVLVSEQRVDLDDDAVKPAAMIRPRRIGAAALTVAEVEDDFAEEAPLSPEEARNFAEFADRLGAANLAELLEAAAAYTATVEGMPHFSRPHILRKVSGYTEEDEFTREDGLRSFGMLLRQGKIQKISRGQFTITESSRFMSEARRAAR